MTADITTVATRIVYENRWMRVREDEIRHRDGSCGVYGVVEKTNFAVIVPVEDSSTYLVEQYRYPVKGRYWEFPQGAWEQAPDTDPLVLAGAELLEETGLTADEMVQVGHLFEGYGYSTQSYDVYLARGLAQHNARRERTEQDMVCRRFGIDEVEQMIVGGMIKDAATVAAFGLLRLQKLT
ncbi:NUDIX domain-containing protein [Microvirga sp. GCM10011540]|uniref:NUDIX domain-containing protein n=1 Tax=Microvirga sp. GCM10011540 TaxID=3317338 RepID=UPI003608A6B1